MGLTSRQRTDLEVAGYTVVEDVVPEADLRAIDEHVTRKIAALPRGARSEHLDLAHKGDDFLLSTCRHPAILEIVRSLLGDDISLFSSHLISKPARDGLGVPWHQDASYWPLDPMRVYTVWLAVDASTPENGCLRVIPASHRRGEVHHDPVPEEPEGRPKVLDQEVRRERFDSALAVDVSLRPGSISIHDPLLIHGSNPNTSERRRCGYTMRFMPSWVRLVPSLRPGFPADWPVYVVSGTDAEGRPVIDAVTA